MTSIDSEPKHDDGFKLLDCRNEDDLTFLIRPDALVVNYDNDQHDTTPRPGTPGPWEASDRWIGR